MFNSLCYFIGTGITGTAIFVIYEYPRRPGSYVVRQKYQTILSIKSTIYCGEMYMETPATSDEIDKQARGQDFAQERANLA